MIANGLLFNKFTNKMITKLRERDVLVHFSKKEGF